MFTLLLTVLFTYVNVPSAEMREEPSGSSRVASGVIYSEKVEIMEEQPEWTKIQTSDGYTGWVKKGVLHQTEEQLLNSPYILIAKVNRCSAHVYNVKDTEWGPILTLPFDSLLEVTDQFGEPDGRWLQVRLVDGTEGFIERGNIILNPKPITREEMLSLSLRFLGLPYTWGGRSSFGYDCSAFMQMLHKQMGISIPRDSKDQVNWDGFQEVAIDAMQPGDLIFFGRVPPKVVHVGMYLGQGKFIHANVRENKPYISISDLNSPIWNGSPDVVWQGRAPLVYRVARTLKH